MKTLENARAIVGLFEGLRWLWLGKRWSPEETDRRWRGRIDAERQRYRDDVGAAERIARKDFARFLRRAATNMRASERKYMLDMAKRLEADGD